MRRFSSAALLSGLLLSCLALSSASAAVSGRYVRVEAPASSRMNIYEIELWAGGRNIALKNSEIKFAGIGYRGRDINFRGEQRRFIDGIIDRKSRAFEVSTDGAVNPWVELDLGQTYALERIVVHQPEGPAYDDRALRLVTVLDEQRRVVYVAHWDIRRPPFDQGVATFDLAPTKHALAGRVVPEGSGGWVPLGELMEARSQPAPADAAQRRERFRERNSAESVEQLARAFCERLDLSKPELATVRQRYQSGDLAGALNAYRDHFLRKLQGITFLHEHPLDSTFHAYPKAADDLLNNVAVVFSRFDVEAVRFEPGTINWGHISKDGDTISAGALDTARARVRAGRFQRPLLTAYRETGRPEYLRQWATITDDWGMNILHDLENSEQDLRDYFVKTELQEFNHLADELAQTVRERPELAQALPATTLARLLIPVLEEYPPAYWWPCRRVTFNHTYNALNAATTTVRILDDFHAGQRLAWENRQHWQRIWTMCMTRDGSMNEVGDEGHMFMPWRMGVQIHHMRKSPPLWFTPDFDAEFETGWKQMTTYPIRHLSPDGRGHRINVVDLFPEIWELTTGICTYGGMIPRETVDSTPILRLSAVRSILQSVYGAGRQRESLPPEKQEAWDQVIGFYGREFEPPETTSDWMPYTGMWYLRRSWEPDATFVSMVCQPSGHPSANGSTWNTMAQYWDHGQPLYKMGPVSIDRQPQFDAAGRRTYWPGSKTVELTTSGERPIPARWYTSPTMDYAEAFFEGTYQRHGVNGRLGRLELGDNPVTGTRADRRVVLFKPARLAIVTDAVMVPRTERPRSYQVPEYFGGPEIGKRVVKLSGQVEGAAARSELKHPSAPGVTVRRFSPMKLEWSAGTQPDWTGKPATISASSRDGFLMVSLIEPHVPGGASTVQSTRDLSTDGIAGFSARLNDGSTLIWLTALNDARPLQAEGVGVQGQSLLLWWHGKSVYGMALGVESFSLGGKPVATPRQDFAFTLADGKLQATEGIDRPIEPVTFSPAEPVFVDRVQVAMHSATPGVEIRYTLDGSEPTPQSTLYEGPITIEADAYIRARAFRPGIDKVPFATAGTQATVISDARYRKAEPSPAIATLLERQTEPGLNWELVDGVSHFALLSHLHLPSVLPAAARGTTRELLDVSMRRGDGPFGVRYEGYLNVPSDGVWTFHAPPEYVGANCEPGYDLRLWIDGQEWDLGQRFHGRGIWSIALKKGLHTFKVTFADVRHRDRTVPRSGLWRGYPTPWVLWQGESPVIEISGPQFEKQPIPAAWLLRAK